MLITLMRAVQMQIPDYNMATIIQAKKDLYNKGKCFTKGKIYKVQRSITTEASLIDIQIINDLGEPHNIGSWWRNFKIIKHV